MSLARFITLLTGIAVTVILLTSAGLYVTAWRAASAERQQASRSMAEDTAGSLREALGWMTQSLEGLARDPLLAGALASGDPERLRAQEERITRLVPGALLIRLLPENTQALDEARAPAMGFADLQMARQALTEPPAPALHGLNTPHVHLALARRLEGGGGIILASLAPDTIYRLLPGNRPASSLELRQGELSLHYSGPVELREIEPAGEVVLPGTAWKLLYRDAGAPFLGQGWLLLIPALGAVLLIASFHPLRRWLIAAMRADQENIAQLVKEVMKGRALGNYPMRIRDGESIIQKIAQLQHELRAVRAANNDTSAAEARLAARAALLEGVKPPAPKTARRPALPSSIFRAYDIRGVVGQTLTPEMVFELGRAIGSEAHARGESRVAIARDGRLSSEEFGQALARGLLATGRHVVDLGLVPSPVLYFATHVLDGKSGVMVTGSHNPAEYNGLKIVIGGETLAGQDIQRLRERVETGDYVAGEGRIETRDLVPDYVERIVEDTQLGRSMKIVVDAGNGVAGKVAPALLKTLGCDVVELYCEVDGHFPNHHPDPGDPRNLAELIATVVRERADLGVAFDGDGDRLGVVDCDGKIIQPDRQMMVFAADVLSRHPGSDIVYDVKCTRHLAGQIVRNGGRPVMWKTGHSLLKAKLRETGAMLAGEMSGHIFFKERWYGFDDGVYAAVRLIEILSGDPRSTAEIFAELPDSVNTPELHIPLDEGENVSLMEKLKAIAEFPDARITDIDGLRVDFVDGWGLVRASNTMPSLSLRFEADDEKSLARIQALFRDLLSQIKTDIRLPF